MATINETLDQFSFLADFWFDDQYAKDFFIDMKEKNINDLTDNQKNFFKKSVDKIIEKIKKDRVQKVLEDNKPFLICYREEILKILKGE